MQLQPIVRVILTALAAGIGAAATQIDNETLRVVAAVLVPTLAAIGIYPPQAPVRTSLIEKEPVSVVRDEDGVTLVEVGVACGIVALAVVVLALADVVKL